MEEATVVPAARPRLRTDVFWTLGGKAATLLFGLLIVVAVARELGPSGQGLFAVAYSLALMLAQLGGLGLTTANPYFTAREPARRASIVANSLWLAVGFGVVLVGIGLAVRVLAPDALEGLGWEPLLVTLVGVPGFLAALFLQSVLLGESRMVAYNVVEATQVALMLTGMLLAFLAFDAGLTGALLVLTAGRYVAVAAYLALLAPGRFDPRLARRMLSYGLRAYVAIVVSFVVLRLDLLLVNGYLGSREAGLYSVAATLADGMFVLPMVVALNLLPRVARSGESQETAEVFRSFAVLWGLLCLATAPLAPPAIRLAFGERFDGSVSLYWWLLPGIYSLGMLTILAHYFAGRGYPTAAAAIWFLGLGLNVAINVAFLPGRGAWVAALASSIAYAVLLLLHAWLFARETGWAALIPRPREAVRFVRRSFSR